MKFRLRTHPFLTLLLAAAVLGTGFLVSVQNVYAETPTVILTVNGGNNASVLNDELVTLEWYIDGSVSSCTINNEVGAIDVSSLPASDSVDVEPPEDGETSYILNCNGTTDSVSVTLDPQISMSLPQGNNRVNDPTTGYLFLTEVDWQAQYANRCSNVWRVKASDPGNEIEANSSNRYVNKNEPSGSIRYRGWPHGHISETTTFYIECFNDVSGASSVDQVTLVVSDPPPPPPPVVNVWTNDPLITRDPLLGYAYPKVSFSASDVKWCNYDAFRRDDDDEWESYDPSGWGKWGGHSSGNFWPRITETTRFEVSCSRPSVTLDGTVYPASSDIGSTTVAVATGTEVDRGTLPPVTAELNVSPNPTQAHPITRAGLVRASTSASNANYCYRFAYRFDSDDGAYTDRYNLSGWTRKNSWDRLGGNHTNQEAAFYLSEDTRLEVYCLREYDRDNFDPGDPEYENGVERTSELVEVLPPTQTAPPPVSYLYGNANRYNTEDLRDLSTSNSYVYKNHSGSWLEIPNALGDGSGSASLTLDFDHPFDGSDQYNIHLRVCDETDGESTFRVFIEGSLVGSYTTDSPFAVDNSCNNSDNRKRIMIANAIEVGEGDEVRVECDTPADGERCRLFAVGFGTGDDGTIGATPSTTTGFVDMPLWQLAEYADRCVPQDAVTDAGLTYGWGFSNSVDRTTVESVATSTTFGIRCEQDGSGLTDDSTVRVELPSSMEITSESLVASGECRDPNPPNDVIDAPDGFIAGPGGICVPAVDLAAATPAVSVSTGNPDAVNGTWDNIQTILRILNLGPGALEAASGVTYKANMTFHPAYALPVLDTVTETFNDPISAPPSGGQEPSGNLPLFLSDVPFGEHEVCSRVNLDGSPDNYPEANADPANNTACSAVTVPVPEPEMNITNSRDIIRQNQSVTIGWDIHVSYDMSCVVQGAGGLNESFNITNEIANGYDPTAGPYMDSTTITGLESTSEFVFRCEVNVPGTGTSEVFTRSVTVEVLPTFEEI